MKCKKCGKEIRYVKVGTRSIPASIGSVLVIPSTHGVCNTFVAEYGAFIQGNVDTDGIKCYLIHKCNIEKSEVETTKSVDDENEAEQYLQLSLFDTKK